jgi:hypothetical protein
MREKKMADVEALKQLRLIDDEVEQKKDSNLPESMQTRTGADILYRNLKLDLTLDAETYEMIILELTAIVHRMATVDWWRNFEAKRQMRRQMDDYLYDIVKIQQGISLTNDQIDKIIEATMTLAENNHTTFGQ